MQNDDAGMPEPESTMSSKTSFALDAASPEVTAWAKESAQGKPPSRALAESLQTPFAPVIAKLLRRRDVYRYHSAREVWDDLRQRVWW